MPRNEVEIALSLQDRMSKPLQGAGNNLNQFKATVGKAAIGIAVMTAAVAGTIAVAKKFVDAAREQQNAERTLGVVIQNSTGDWDKHRSAILAATAALQNKTNYGDEEQIRALSRIVAITGDVNKAMQILPTVLDAATISGGSLETVALTLTRALTGQANTAESLGLTFEATATFAERLAIAQGVAGGAAEANLDPFIQLSNATGDLSEAIGKRLLPAIGMGTGIITGFIKDLTEIVEQPSLFTKGMKEFFDLMDERERMARRERLASEQQIRLNEANAKSLDELGVWQGKQIDNSDEMAAAYKNSGASLEFVIPVIDRTIQRNADLALSFTVTQANAEAFAQRYREQTDRQIADLEKLAQQETRLAEEREKAEDQAIEMRQSVKLMGWEIEGVVRKLKDEGVALSGLRMLQKAFEEGNLKGAVATKAFADLLEFATGQLKDETAAINDQNRALQKTIELQAAKAGTAIGAGSPMLMNETQIQNAWESMKSNALRHGFTDDGSGNLTNAGGDSLNIDTFRNAMVELMRQGLTPSDAFIQAIRRLRKVFDFDSGGVVPGAIGSPHLAIVHGGEEVLTPGQRGGTTVNVYVAGSVISNQDLKNFINRTIIDTERAGGGVRRR